MMKVISEPLRGP